MVGRGERHRAVGGLSSDHDFPRGTIPIGFLDLLKRHVTTACQPMAFGGGHTCEFCGNKNGYGNLWIPTTECVYVAPELIIHYITEHEYLPPSEFCDAVAACPPQNSPEFMRLLRPYLSYFGTTPPDPLPTSEQQVQIAKLLTTAFCDIARLCREGDSAAAAVLADACADIPSGIHGWGFWYRHIFSRLVRNGRPSYPAIQSYLDEYNAIFGEDTDPELTALEAAQAAAKKRAEETSS